MKRLRNLMARSRPSWFLWMAFGTTLVIPLVIIDLLLDTVRSLHAEYRWHYKDELKQFFSYFGERHRNALRSLGQKPLP